MKVSVVGAGKMGLPIAVQFALKGAEVFACDARQETVDALNRGECTIDEPGVPEALSEVVDAGRLIATVDTEDAVRRSDVVVIIVPALLLEDNRADLGILETVTRQVKNAMHPGLLISYETTLPVGTTRQRFMPLLETEGMVCGEDYFVVFSPERVKSGYVLERLDRTPKVVGGADSASLAEGKGFYEKYLGAPVIQVESLEAAEFVKLAGMLYRDVNIALANEMARYAESVGIDFTSIIDPANTNGEAGLLFPGVGVGGHCCPVYPYFLIHDANDRGLSMELAERSRVINDRQSAHVVDRLAAALGPLQGMRVCILGLGFRPGVKEHICSPAFLLRDELSGQNAEVELVDSLYTKEEIEGHGFTPGNLGAEFAPDAIILNTVHEEFVNLDFSGLAERGLKAVVDGRNRWCPDAVRTHDLIYLGVGR